ncbi:extracellular solute-binding protein [Paenibacillus prosopidis]|uniref:Putative aldouronate transport system substrate-binding protein n=1 Tax=Paenibacillus prosopidis TaxID=630520 RepID=A0A368VVL4_9BACL|nr:extracellular solute-binding protein [Paenibacillus prosopidis]RCW43473.1 putative aldouronate transport system substrate-binding protein [Paenibacillus prosopidis]
MKHRKTAGILSFVLCLAMILTACSGKNDNGSNSSNAPSTEPNETNAATTEKAAPAVDPFGKYDPPITITAAKIVGANVKFKEGEDLQNNVWSKLYADTLGVTVDYAWTTPDLPSYEQKMNLTIASGELPDVFTVTANMLNQLVEAGLVEDLTAAIDQYAAPITKEILKAAGKQPLQSATFDGKVYGFPATGSAADIAPVLYVRTDWLKKLNLPEPKTMADLLAISDAFTNQDPDGNGKKDTYGLALTKDSVHDTNVAGLQGFMNGYHAYLDIWINDASGKLVFGGIQPEVKQALAQLQQMYKTGQIDKEFGTKDAGKVGEDLNRIGMQFGRMWNPGWPLQGQVTSNPGMEWTPYPIPSIDDKPALAATFFPVNSYLVVRKGFEHPELAVKMMNLYYEKNFGPTADPATYNKTPEGVETLQYAIMMAEPPTKNYDAHIKVVDALKSGDTSKLNAEELGYVNEIKQFNEGDINKWAANKIFGPGGSQSVLGQYITGKLTQPDEFYGAPTPTMAQRKSSLDTLMEETFAKIIMGGASIDEFDKYVENWKKLGGDAITQEVNDWYSSK